MTRRVTSLLLCLTLLLCCATAAHAENQSLGDATGILDEQELTERVENILNRYSLNGERVAVGFYYSGTGDTYCYSGDTWMYSASLFKVPLYMTLYDEISDGNIRESGTRPTIARVEAYRDAVLINSITSTALNLMRHFGSYEDSRREYRRYSTLPDDYFPDHFYYSSNFTARFMIDVMAWLVDHSDDYDKVLDSLYRSPLREDLASVGESYPVAQKYGDFFNQKVNVHHVAAVIGTPTPIAVVVMTQWVPVSRHRQVMNAIATMLAEYSLELDQQLAADREN